MHCAEDVDLRLYYEQYPLKQQHLTFSERVGYRNRMRLLQRQGVKLTHRILDYGCGAGLFVNFLRGHGFRDVFGYDAFVSEYLANAEREAPYDAVVSYDVIEHDDDTRKFMRSLADLVKPGGVLVIGTPNADHIPLTAIQSPSLHPPYHRHILSERVLLDLGKGQGLEPVHIYRRSFYDSLVPTVNSRFMWRYIQKSGGLLDAAVEPPKTAMVLKSPAMVFLAFCGYFVPLRDNILVTFRKGRDGIAPVQGSHWGPTSA
ncbi:MAG: class I SAM-dependent methyltransferase [Bryobacteraceae bacterium]